MQIYFIVSIDTLILISPFSNLYAYWYNAHCLCFVKHLISVCFYCALFASCLNVFCFRSIKVSWLCFAKVFCFRFVKVS